jgi:hypothetical protein
MTSKQVRDARDAKQAAKFAAKAIEMSNIGSDHRYWEVRQAQYIAGTIRQFHSLPGDTPNGFQAFGRKHIQAPMKLLGMFRSLGTAISAIEHN